MAMAKGGGSFVKGILYIRSKHRSEWTFLPLQVWLPQLEGTSWLGGGGGGMDVRGLFACPTLQEFGN